MKTVKNFSVLSIGILLTLFSSLGHALTVTVSVTPLAGVIAPLLGEQDQLHVILKPGQSPHSFQMSPADMRLLASSDLLLTVGTPVDAWIEKPQQSLKVPVLSVHDLAGLYELPVRQGGIWERHVHKMAKQEHDNHVADAGQDEREAHDHDEHDENKGHEEHQAIRKDGHLWMSVDNMLLLVKAASVRLQELMPQQAQQIKQREQAWLAKLAVADAEVAKQLQAVRSVPYMILHDAFQYFEKRYQLTGVGSIQLNPSVSPSLKRVSELRERIKAGQVKCVFKEPQFPAKRVLTVTRGLDVQVGSLDPIGLVTAEEAKQSGRAFLLYDEFIKRLASQYLQCLR